MIIMITTIMMIIILMIVIRPVARCTAGWSARAVLPTRATATRRAWCPATYCLVLHITLFFLDMGFEALNLMCFLGVT